MKLKRVKKRKTRMKSATISTNNAKGTYFYKRTSCMSVFSLCRGWVLILLDFFKGRVKWLRQGRRQYPPTPIRFWDLQVSYQCLLLKKKILIFSFMFKEHTLCYNWLIIFLPPFVADDSAWCFKFDSWWRNVWWSQSHFMGEAVIWKL